MRFLNLLDILTENLEPYRVLQYYIVPPIVISDICLPLYLNFSLKKIARLFCFQFIQQINDIIKSLFVLNISYVI